MSAQLQALITRARRWGPERWLTLVLVVLAALVVLQGLRYAGTMFGARGLAASAKKAGAAPPERDSGQAVEDFEPLVKKGIFGKGPPQPPGMKLFGIIGNEALLGPDPSKAKPVPVGGTAPTGEKVVEVNADSVVVEKDGNKKTLKVFPDFKPK
ncbi:MAG: hypothetical protein GY851_30075 [bacterium]|nr:hypothetical protein [bacterium]